MISGPKIAERYINCAWHPGGRKLVERKTGLPATKEIVRLFRGTPKADSDGLCKPCQVKEDARIEKEYKRRGLTREDRPLFEGPMLNAGSTAA